MREILFRGKSDLLGWVEGWYCPEVKWGEHHFPVGITHKAKEGWLDDVAVMPQTVGQFTGLTDKNGKRAFEHDVIKHHFWDEIGVIRYGEYRNPFGDDSHGGHVGFYVDWVSGTEPGLLRKDLAYWMKIVEILGNIHDNPELLGGAGGG